MVDTLALIDYFTYCKIRIVEITR